MLVSLSQAGKILRMSFVNEDAPQNCYNNGSEMLFKSTILQTGEMSILDMLLKYEKIFPRQDCG
jgi:hypothetical protein